jgi:hypothetical protein
VESVDNIMYLSSRSISGYPFFYVVIATYRNFSVSINGTFDESEVVTLLPGEIPMSHAWVLQVTVEGKKPATGPFRQCSSSVLHFL